MCSHPDPTQDYGDNEIGTVLTDDILHKAVATLERGNGNKYDPISYLVRENGHAYEITIRLVS